MKCFAANASYAMLAALPLIFTSYTKEMLQVDFNLPWNTFVKKRNEQRQIKKERQEAKKKEREFGTMRGSSTFLSISLLTYRSSASICRYSMDTICYFQNFSYVRNIYLKKKERNWIDTYLCLFHHSGMILSHTMTAISSFQVQHAN